MGNPLYGAKDVEEFCKDKTLQVISERFKEGAWIDDRSRAGEHREYQDPLTAYTLFQKLKERRFVGEKPDTNERRLIFIKGLDPYYILALVETAPWLQVQVLRDAFQKYLALETSLLTLKGISVFRLELHLPYFALRQSKKLASSHARNKRRCIDELSFLTRRSKSGPSQHKIFKAQISFVISGCEDSQWVVKSFIDNYFEEEELLDDVDGLPYNGFVEGPIAKGQLGQNERFVNPREYFLMILKIRSEQILKEWERVVQSVRRNVKPYV
jgi:hypothetical protein